MLSDPLASVRPWAIDGIHIYGQHFTVPATTADQWLRRLLAPDIDLWTIVPGMLQPSDAARNAVIEAMFAGELTREQLEETVWEIVGVAAGRDWWTALILLGTAKSPQFRDIISGRLVMAGVDATRISLSAWLDAVYGICLERLNATQRTQFNNALARPPKGATVIVDRERAVSAFGAVMGMG